MSLGQVEVWSLLPALILIAAPAGYAAFVDGVSRGESTGKAPDQTQLSDYRVRLKVGRRFETARCAAQAGCPNGRSEIRLACVLIIGAVAYAAYFVLRFGGLWAENDSAVFSAATAGTISVGSVLFPHQYAHGFGYPAWLSSMALLTGLRPSIVNGTVAPFFGSLLLVIGGFVAYRSLLHSAKSATLGILFLLATPDLMFSVLRGNHEKLNIFLLLVSLFCLVRVFTVLRDSRSLGCRKWVFVFFALSFADTTIHDYFAACVLLALAVTTVVLHIFSRFSTGTEAFSAGGFAPPLHGMRSLTLTFAAMTAASCAILLFVAFVVFPPAGHDALLARPVVDRLHRMVASHHLTSNPYAAPSAQWVNPFVLAGLAAFRWILSTGSFLSWITNCWRISTRRRRPSLEDVLVVSFYGAFGALVVVSVPVDFSGVYFGTNFELRNFTIFALIAAPLLAKSVHGALSWDNLLLPPRSRFGRFPSTRLTTRGSKTVAVRALAIAMAFLLVLGFLKTTLEPLASNQWMFYSTAEKEALEGFLRHTSSESMWTGADNRLPNVIQDLSGANTPRSRIEGFALRPRDEFLLYSPVIVANLRAHQQHPPTYRDMDRVFDAGAASIYMTRSSESKVPSTKNTAHLRVAAPHRTLSR
jgi:hypothetical protein